MRISHSVLLVVSLSLGACGFVRDSALNPVNWFGRGTSVAMPSADGKAVNPLIPQSSGLFGNRNKGPAAYVGQPFDEITNLTIERVAGGAIVRATGLAARQGIYAVQLTPATPDETAVDGVLTYRLEGVEPDKNTAVGSPATREVTAARKVTDQNLIGVRSIRVEGLRNAQVARR
jgi:hypothetical protein